MAVARRKGEEAAKAGAARESCPYADIRNYKGTITFSRAFRTAWFAGFDSVKQQP